MEIFALMRDEHLNIEFRMIVENLRYVPWPHRVPKETRFPDLLDLTHTMKPQDLYRPVQLLE